MAFQPCARFSVSTMEMKWRNYGRGGKKKKKKRNQYWKLTDLAVDIALSISIYIYA